MKAFHALPAGRCRPWLVANGGVVAHCTVALIALTALTGCRQGVFDAATLPPEYRAPAPRGTEALELTSLTQSTLRNDRVYPGDELEVTVATGVERLAPPIWYLRVDDRGQVDVPLVGRVKIAGRTLTQAEADIVRACVDREIYRAPIVTLAVSQRKTNHVTVVGAVGVPGVYELASPSSDVLSALAAAGGVTEEADNSVEVRHPPGTGPQWGGRESGDPGHVQPAVWEEEGRPAEPRSVRIAMHGTAEGDAANQYLADGAVVMVPTKPARTIHVLGKVNQPNTFDLPDDRDLHLLDAIALAGGRTVQLADKVRLVRNVPGRSDPVVVDISVREAKRNGAANLRLAPEDVVSVEETPATFVIETLRNVIRFGFSAAMPLF